MDDRQLHCRSHERHSWCVPRTGNSIAWQLVNHACKCSTLQHGLNVTAAGADKVRYSATAEWQAILVVQYLLSSQTRYMCSRGRHTLLGGGGGN